MVVIQLNLESWTKFPKKQKERLCAKQNLRKMEHLYFLVFQVVNIHWYDSEDLY
jgi:hypothetical protein